MAGWWGWFRRRRRRAVGLPGPGVGLPDGDVPGRLGRWAGVDDAAGLVETSRCDDALVYERPEERRAALADSRRAGDGRSGRRGRGGW
jgi:hypothetical protein